MNRNIRKMMTVSCMWAGLLLAGSSASAAVVTWDSVLTISGDADVSTIGTLERAYTFDTGVAGPTVNGVLFTPFLFSGSIGTLSATVGSTTVSSSKLLFGGGVGSGSPPYSSLSSDYRGLLGGDVYNFDPSVNPGIDLTLAGLTVGQGYLFQAWVNESRAIAGRTEKLSGGGSDSGSLAFNTTSVDGGVGQFVIGRFTADSTSQLITFIPLPTGDLVGQIQGFQLRELVVPESSTVGLLALGACLVWGRMRRS